MSQPNEILTCPKCGALITATLARCRQCGKILTKGSFANLLGGWAPSQIHLVSSLVLILIFNFMPFVASLLAVGGMGFAPFPSYTMVQQGALAAALVILDEPWRLVTANFVHFNILHLVMNGFALVQLTPLIENLFDRPKAFLIFVVSGTLTTASFFVLGAWIYPQEFFHSVAGGASAGVFGFLGAGIAGAKKYDFRAQSVVASLRNLVIVNIIFGLIILPLGSNVLHLFGFAYGLLLGRVLPAGPSRHQPLQAMFNGAFVLCAVLIVVSFGAQVWRNRDFPLAVPDAEMSAFYKRCFSNPAKPPDFYFEQKREAACEYALRAVPAAAPQIYFTLLNSAIAMGDPLRISKYEALNEKLARALPKLYRLAPTPDAHVDAEATMDPNEINEAKEEGYESQTIESEKPPQN